MTDTAKIATLSPRNLISQSVFWSSNPGLPIAVALSLVGAVGILRLATHPSGGLLDYFAGMIYLLVFWGIAEATLTLARIQVQSAVAEHVNALALEQLRGIESRQRERPELHRLETELLPNNPSPEISMIRLFQQIVQEAKDRKFHPSAVLMQPYREESFGGLFKLQTIQKTALQLGILGTFVGLILALSELSGAAGLSSLDISALMPLFRSLNISFGTSIAGIAVSIILGVTVMAVRRRLEGYFQTMEDATVSLSALTRRAINRDELLVELNQVQVAINQLGERILRQSEDIESQTTSIREGLTKLGSARIEFDGFLQKLGDDQRRFLDDLRQLHDRLGPAKITEQLEAGLAASAQRLSEAALETRTEVYAALKRVVVKHDELISEFQKGCHDRRIEELGKQLQQSIKAITGTLSIHHAELLRQLDSLNSGLSMKAASGRGNGDGYKDESRLKPTARSIHLSRREDASGASPAGLSTRISNFFRRHLR